MTATPWKHGCHMGENVCNMVNRRCNITNTHGPQRPARRAVREASHAAGDRRGAPSLAARGVSGSSAACAQPSRAAGRLAGVGLEA
jgi:hypothetical protein